MLFVGCQKAAPVKVDVTKVTLDKTEAGVMIDGTVTLTASVEPVNAWIQDIVWTSDNEAVATVDEAGKVTGIAKGTATVKAVAKDKESVFATCTVTVTDKPIRVSGLELNKVKSDLYVGDKDTLVVTVLPAIATDQSVVWKSSDETVAVVDSGRVVALAEGTAKITVRSIDGDKTASCNVEVYKKEVTLTAPAKLTVCVDSTASIGATVDPDSLKILYRSDRPFIKVDSLGNVVASQPGEGTITVTVEDTDEFEGDETVVKVTVLPVFEIFCDDVIQVSCLGDSFTFDICSFTDWKVSCSDDSFVTLGAGNAEAGETTLTVTVAGNTDPNDGRTADITFSSAEGDELKTISIVQAPYFIEGYYIYVDVENYQKLLSVVAAETPSTYGDYIISGLGIYDNSKWWASYDYNTNKLVCSGIEVGYEDYGNQFNGFYDFYNEAGTKVYGYWVYSDTNYENTLPYLAFNVDEETGQLASFSQECQFCVDVYNYSSGAFIGTYTEVNAGTELTPYSSLAAPASVAALKDINSLSKNPAKAGKKAEKSPRLK